MTAETRPALCSLCHRACDRPRLLADIGMRDLHTDCEAVMVAMGYTITERRTGERRTAERRAA